MAKWWGDILNAALLATGRDPKRMRQAIDEHAIVSIADATGTITYVNDKFCAVSGYDRDALLGNNHRVVRSGHHSSAFYRDMWRTIASGKTWQGEICNRRKDGSIYWVESTITPFTDGPGKPYQYVAIRTDITKIKVAELALRESESFAKATIDAVSASLCVLDTRGTIISVNQAWRDFYDQNGAEPKGRDKKGRYGIGTDYLAVCRSASGPNGDEAGVVAEGILAVMAGERDTFSVEYPCHSPTEQRWFNARITRFQDDSGYLVVAHENITERKHSELALVAARDEADRANRAKSQFLSSMSHELRTPMNSVLGFAQLMALDRSVTADQRDNLEHIMLGGRHLLELINDLLNLSQIEAGEVEVSRAEANGATLIAECVALVTPLAEKRHITLETGKIASAKLYTDRRLLKQVLINLLGNAIKYNRKGGTVRVSMTRTRAGSVSICVTDTGVGIAQERLSELFEPFNRLGAEFGEIEGSGVGLTVCKRLMEAMGGRIDVASERGVGSEFRIILPMPVRTKSAATPVRAIRGARPSTTARTPDAAVPTSVLVIDDNHSNLKLMHQIIKQTAHLRMIEAASAEEGIELARSTPPGIILMDINLPGMDGFMALHMLRADPLTRTIPVVAVSALAMPKDIARAREAGFDDYLVKPVSLNQVTETIGRLAK